MAMTAEEVRAQMDRAIALYKDRQWQEAIDRFAELVFEPEGVHGADEMHWNMAMCFAHLGNMQLAEQHVQAGGHSMEEFRDTYARSVFEHAKLDYDAGRWDEAANGFAEVLLLPGYPAEFMHEAHWNIGMCNAQLGNWELAFQHATQHGGSADEFRQRCIDTGLTPPDPQ